MRKAFYLRKKYAREMIPYCEEDAQVVIFHLVRGKAVEQVITRYANLGASQVRCEWDNIVVGFIDILAGEEVEGGANSSKTITLIAAEERAKW